VESRRSRSAYGFFTFHLPPSTWFGRQTSVLRVLLGIGWGFILLSFIDSHNFELLGNRF